MGLCAKATPSVLFRGPTAIIEKFKTDTASGVILVFVTIIAPLLTYIFIRKHKLDQFKEEAFKKRYSSLYLDVDPDRGYSALLISMGFFMKRALFCALIYKTYASY
jgi:hypothetical protein